MPLLDKLFPGKKKKEEEKEEPQRVSEEAARKRREELARKQREAGEAAKRAQKATEERLKALKEKEQEAVEDEKKEQEAVEEVKKVAPKASKYVSIREAEKAKEKRTYVVKGGDSLSKIAKNLYGDASRWPEIYEANKDVIGDNPNLIHPGQEYRIP